MTDNTNNAEDCPCGSGQRYTQCCGPYLAGRQLPATAEALMRSRYSAYVSRDEDYLLKTWHPTTRPLATDFNFSADLKWLGLKISATCGGGRDDRTGQVEFVARYKIAGKANRMWENSRFVREHGRWYYLDGDPMEK